jgi:hypothetical protein
MQRTEEWFKQRIGRFTASRISELLGAKGLGLTGENYAFEKAIEIVYGIDHDDNYVSYDMQRGIDLEPVAFERFKYNKSLDFIDVEKCGFFPNGDNSGSSPDGLVSTDGILEIKCPKPHKVFRSIKDGIESIDKKYIAQMQKQMYDTNSSHGYFFNYAIFNGEEVYCEIKIERDNVMVEFIEKRIELAVVKRDEYVEQLLTKKVA